MSLSILIPTAGRDTLARCLDSVKPQLQPDDECLVIGDTHGGRLEQVRELVWSYGPRYRYLEHDAGHHCFGHCQLNYGIERAYGDYLVFNDDDDIFTPRAFEQIRYAYARQTTPAPLLFRFEAFFGAVMWDRRQVVENHIGGHCAVFPNIPGRVGRFTCRYQGDYDFIRSTLDLWPGGDQDAAWIDRVIAIARPSVEQDWTRQRSEASA